MDRRHTLFVLCLINYNLLIRARPQPRDDTPVGTTGSSTSPGPRGGNAVRFDFRSDGGAMKVLGRQHLAQISSQIAFKGSLSTLAQHLDDDDDLVSVAH